MPTYFRKIISVISCVSIIMQPFHGLAQVVSDPSAPTANQANVISAPNGVTQVDISSPNQAGFSHNKFLEYNIAPKGLILNNRGTSGDTGVAGIINGNPYITPGSEAHTIINEVTSDNTTLMLGTTEVAGRNANVIIVNPNGITCNGCAFINTDRVSLSTGTAIFDNQGNITGFEVDKGSINIGLLGLNAEASSLDIIARATEIIGAVKAGESINIITGRNDVNYADLVTLKKADDGSVKPEFAIDGSAFGAFIAGRINIKATEDGVGVRMLGNMATSTADMHISANGRLELGNLSSARDITIEARSLELANGANIAAGVDPEGEFIANQGNLNITARDSFVTGENSILRGGNLVAINSEGDINSASIISSDGDIEIISTQGDIDLSGKISSRNANITIDSDQGSIRNRAVIYAANNLNLNAGSDIILSESVLAGQNINIGATNLTLKENKIINAGSEDDGSNILNQGDVVIDLQGDLNIENLAKLRGGNLVDIKAANFTNKGLLSSNGEVDLVIDGNIENFASMISGGSFNIDASSFTSDLGSVIQAVLGPLTFNIANHFENAGVIRADENMLIINSESLENKEAGYLQSFAGLNLNITNSLTNKNIITSSNNAINLIIRDLVNNGRIIGNQGVTITAGNNITNNSAAIINSAAGLLQINAKQLYNEGVLIAANEAAELNVDYFTNKGTLFAKDSINAGALIDATRMKSFINEGYINSAEGDISIFTENFQNISNINIVNRTYRILSAHMDESPEKFMKGDYANYAISSNHLGQLSDEGRVGYYILVPNERKLASIMAANNLTYADLQASGLNPYLPTEYYEGFYDDWAIYTLDEYFQDDKFKTNNTNGILYTINQNIADLGYNEKIAFISSQTGNINIDTLSGINRAARITAAGNINLTGSQIYQEDFNFGSTVTLTTNFELSDHFWSVGWYAKNFNNLSEAQKATAATYIHLNNTSPLITSSTSSSIPSVIAAGGNVNINAENFTTGINNARNKDLNSPSTVKITEIELEKIPTFGDPVRSITPPASLRQLIQDATPNSPSIIETRFDYTDWGTYHGSKYFLDTLNLENNLTKKFLGDSYIDTRIIEDQILTYTGRRFLSNNLTNMSEQMLALIDAAENVYEDLELSLGVTLTKEQQASLNQDIIWYVTAEYKGQKVLVPQLYLADAASMVKNAGTIISGDNVIINADNINANNLNILADNQAVLTVESDISLASSTIDAGTVSMQAGNNIEVKTHQTITGNADNIQGAIIHKKSKITARTLNIDINADKDIAFEGEMEANQDINLTATNVKISPLKVVHKLHLNNTESDSVTVESSSLTAGNNIDIKANENINIEAGNLKANNNIELTTLEGDINITAVGETSRIESSSKTSYSLSESTELKTSSLEAQNRINIDSGQDINIAASALTAHEEDINLKANNNILITSLENSYHRISRYTDEDRFSTTSYANESQAFINEKSYLTSGRDINISSDDNTAIIGSEIKAENNINIASGGEVYIANAVDSFAERADKNRKSHVKDLYLDSFGTTDALKDIKKSKDLVTRDVVRSNLTSNSDININSDKDITLAGSSLDAQNNINLESDEKVKLLAAKSYELKASHTATDTRMWQSVKDSGKEEETVEHVYLTAGNELTIDAEKGIEIDVKKIILTDSTNSDLSAEEILNHSIEELSKQPGLEYLAELKDNPAVDFHLIEAAYKEWDDKSQGLTEVGAVIVAVIAAALTAGAGGTILGAVGPGAAGGAAGTAGATGVAAGAGATASATSATLTAVATGAANATFTSLVSKASISLLNNQGNLSAVFEEMGSSEYVQGLAVSILTAGANAGLDLDSVAGALTTATIKTSIEGGSFKDAFKTQLKFALADIIQAEIIDILNIPDLAATDPVLHKLAHGLIGCGAGAINDSCIGGAAGAVTAEFIAEHIEKNNNLGKYLEAGDIEGFNAAHNELKAEIRKQVAISSALAGLVVSGGDPNAIYAANQAGVTAVENNALYLIPVYIGGFLIGYTTSTGKGNPVKGIEIIGEGNDNISVLTQAEVEKLISKSYRNYPDATEKTLYTLALPGEGMQIVAGHIDDATGNKISSYWSELSTGSQNILKGTWKILDLTVSAPKSLISSLKPSPLDTKSKLLTTTSLTQDLSIVDTNLVDTPKVKIIDGENLDDDYLVVKRPTPRESEKYVEDQIGELGERQVSYKGGERVDYGTKGSVRPDICTVDACSFEVKNYDINKNSSGLISAIVIQAKKRAVELPTGMEQKVMIDIRGQKISKPNFEIIKQKIEDKSGGLILRDSIESIGDFTHE